MATKEIVIPEIKIERLVVRVTGITPLITNRFGESAVGQIEDKQGKRAKLERPARNPEAEFREACHVLDLEKQVYGFPAAGIKKSLLAAGYRFAGEKMTVLGGVLSIERAIVEIESPPPTMRRDPVRLSSGVWSIAYRPEFWPWAMEIPISFMADMVSMETVVNLVRIAGQSVGIGSWRVENKGTNGQFAIDGVREELAA